MQSLVRFAALSALFAFATADIPKCGPGSNCPADSPCCSAYGQCGVGAYCLGGCDPQYSHSLTSCIQAPTCKSATYKFDNLNSIAPNTRYLGNTTGVDWVSEGTPVQYNDSTGSSVMLTMAPDTVGTLLSSAHYVWYGKMSAKMKTSAGQGVVTAFIMMSDVKDEIDFEFVGADTHNAQSNYYWQGTLNYTNSENLTASNTDTDVHTYELDWKPDSLTWSIDGTAMRTIQKSGTWNATSGVYEYPQTPSRIMLSLWPAGLSSNGDGTVDWAGGLINWNSPYMTNGYYHAQVYEVDVQCYDPPSGANVQGRNSYEYTSVAGLNNSISVSNDIDVLASFYASGENMNYNPNAPKASASGSKTASVALPTASDVQTVPGVVGGGVRGGDTTSDSSSPGGSSGSGGSSGGVGGTGSLNGFSQGLTSTGGTSGVEGQNERLAKGSVLAVVIALAALAVM